MQAYRGSILPLIAVVLTFLGIFYTGCNDSKADTTNSNPAMELRQEIARFEGQLVELKKMHEGHIQAYSTEMGCVGESKALDIISRHNELLDHLTKRLEYHKLQIIQADTTNSERNKTQLTELKKDQEELSKDGEEIRTGFDQFTPTHATK